MSDNVQINTLKKSTFEQNLSLTFKYIILTIGVLLVFLPVIPIILGSFKTEMDFYKSGVTELPTVWTLENYKVAFQDGGMVRGFINTFFILTISVSISVLLGAMTAYVLHRFVFKGKKVLKNLFLFAALIPTVTNNISVFQIISGLGLFNTRMAGIILFSGTDIIAVYIFLQFLDNISNSIDESAMIDGANYFSIFFKMILPLLGPAIATVAIIKGVGIYNDFTTSFLFMPKPDLAMISTSLYAFKGPYGSQWNVICAGVLIITIPMLIIFLSMQKMIYRALVNGAVKE